jgi:hypothetical protein
MRGIPWRTVLLTGLVLCGASCGPGRWWGDRIVRGPDGTRNWLLIECRFIEDCIALAGRDCLYGYAIEHETQHRKDNSMLVHCLPQRKVTNRQPTPTPASSEWMDSTASDGGIVRELPADFAR